MIYRSNLTAPDLTPYFTLADPVVQHMGHDCPSDPDFEPRCTFLTHDEAAILYHISKNWAGKAWADIGARLGWTASHLLAGGASSVYMIDPEYAHNQAFLNRALRQCGMGSPVGYTSEDFFELTHYNGIRFDAALIDGCHDAPEPTLDAVRAIRAGAKVLVWHDFQGKPVRDAVASVTAGGEWKSRVYQTPNGLAVAWRDDCAFLPPCHVPDPRVDWQEIQERYADFDFTGCV